MVQSLIYINPGIVCCNVKHQRGIPSKRASLIRVDYVPALCTHRLSHLLIRLYHELSGDEYKIYLLFVEALQMVLPRNR